MCSTVVCCCSSIIAVVHLVYSLVLMWIVQVQCTQTSGSLLQKMIQVLDAYKQKSDEFGLKTKLQIYLAVSASISLFTILGNCCRSTKMLFLGIVLRLGMLAFALLIVLLMYMKEIPLSSFFCEEESLGWTSPFYFIKATVHLGFTIKDYYNIKKRSRRQRMVVYVPGTSKETDVEMKMLSKNER